MKKKRLALHYRIACCLMALLLVGVFAIGDSFVMPTKVLAAGQITSASIEMSDSNSGDTNVTYQASFDVATAGQVEGIVIDFCSNDPLIGDPCTAPTGFSLGSTPSVTTNLSGTWTAATNSTAPYSTLILTNPSGVTVTTGQTITVTITGITNPSIGDNTPFYGRLLTYANATGPGSASDYQAGNEGDFTDDGGVALSTGTPILVTARVMETLTFCVYHVTCGDSPDITIGHGDATVLDSTAVDTQTDNFSISTNASEGANVLMEGGTLTSGSNTIPAAGDPSGSATPSAITPGDAAFGMYVSNPGADITPATTYNGNGGTTYGLNTANLSGTYGDTIATLSGPVNNSVTTITFGATASNTTPAGVYTANEQLIATATF